jgi:8-oxo-dGTP diphosphatase
MVSDVSPQVIDDDGRVLVIQRRDNGHWEPPGGVLEIDESFEEGVRREVEEEAGVPVAVDELTGDYKNMQRVVVALVFRCRPPAARPRETAEAATVRWIDPTQITSLTDQRMPLGSPMHSVTQVQSLASTTACV